MSVCWLAGWSFSWSGSVGHKISQKKAGKLHFHRSYRSTCFLHGYGLPNYGQVFDREGHGFITSQGTWFHYVTRYMVALITRYMVSLRNKVHGCITSQGTWFHYITRCMVALCHKVHGFIKSQGAWFHYVTRYIVSLRHKVYGFITSLGTWFHCVTRYMLLFYNHFCTFSCYN